MPYDTIVSDLMNFPSASRNLVGLNSSGSGKIRGSLSSRKKTWLCQPPESCGKLTILLWNGYQIVHVVQRRISHHVHPGKKVQWIRRNPLHGVVLWNAFKIRACKFGRTLVCKPEGRYSLGPFTFFLPECTSWTKTYNHLPVWAVKVSDDLGVVSGNIITI